MIYRSTQSLSQRPIPTTPACGDKYPCWLLATFGNLFMVSFYCTPKEIRALCILGKKNTPFKYSIFHGCVCMLCEHYFGGREQSGFLWSRHSCLQQQTHCLCGEFLLLAQAHRPLLETSQSGRGTHPLLLAWIKIYALETLPWSPERKKEGNFHSQPWLGNSTWPF